MADTPARLYGTNVRIDGGNAYPPTPLFTQTPIPDDFQYPADEVIHLLRSLKNLWQPPVTSEMFLVPPKATPYVTPTPWVFSLPGMWRLSRMTLFPWNARTVGEAYATAAAFPSQVIVTVSAFSAMPFRLDTTHTDYRDLRMAVFNGTSVVLENADATNYGVVYMEFEEINMPDYDRAGR